MLLLERARIASGTSWHAAGLVARVRGSHPMTELANYGVDLYRGLADETGVDVHFRPTGSLTLAENEGRMTELRYAAAIARHHGIEARLLEPADVPEVWPLISTDGLVGALLQPGDGTVNPGYAALALAKGAHDRGVTIREGVRVSALLTEDGAVTGVRTDRGDVEAETVVLACGLWTRDLAATVGVPVPLYAAEHVHVSTEPIEGAHDLLPLVRGLDGSFYARHHAGGLMIGAFEPNGRPRSTASIPEEWAFGEFGPDWEHFAPTRANATRRIPALEHAEFTRYLRAPESFTPDVNFCLGETAEVRNLFVAAGFNSQGIIYSPGAGRALAEWIREGAPTFDASEVDVRRFASSQANEHYLHERTREALGRLYAMHWPNLQATTARGIRRSPLYDRLAAAGACFGELAQWERPMWFAPEGVEPVYGYSFGRQNWFPYAAEEHRAAREAVALFDLSSFAKIEVTGPDALRLLQHVCTNDVDVAIGRLVYTLFLNARGGIENDGTVTRLDTDTVPRAHALGHPAPHARVAPHPRPRDVRDGDRCHKQPRDAGGDGTAEPGAPRPPHSRGPLQRGLPVLLGARDPGGERPGPRDPRLVRRRARVGAVRAVGVRGPRRRGDRRGRAPTSASAEPAITRSTRSGSRRASSTSATTSGRPTTRSPPASGTS